MILKTCWHQGTAKPIHSHCRRVKGSVCLLNRLCYLSLFTQQELVPEAWQSPGMALTELKWSLFQAKALVCSLLLLLCLHTTTGTTTPHLFRIRVEILAGIHFLHYAFVFALTQGCQGGVDVWTVRMCLQQSQKTALREKWLLNSWPTPRWREFTGGWMEKTLIGSCWMKETSGWTRQLTRSSTER